MTATATAIAAIYVQLRAPAWAATNLDALADVLRDLSWLPPGPVQLALSDATPDRVRRVIARAVGETATSDRPVVVVAHP